MPHTPLLRSLVRFVRDHRLAKARGISPADLRAERNAAAKEGAGVTRRDFLGKVAAGGAAVLLGGSLLPACGGGGGSGGGGGGKQPRIAIVGAGIAGLTAALALQDAGLASTVFEASGRIGGRMFSHNTGFWEDGQISEWCGELIDTNHETVLGLAKRFDLPVDDLLELQLGTGADETYFFENDYYSVEDADDDFNDDLADLLAADVEAADYPTSFEQSTPEGEALDNMTVAQWIDDRLSGEPGAGGYDLGSLETGGLDSRLGKLLKVAYEIEFGAPADEQSALNLVYLLGFQPEETSRFQVFGFSDERFHIRGGNQRLPLAIAAALKSPVKIGHRLTQISQADGIATLNFQLASETTTVEADIVLLAIPFAVLRNITRGTAGFDQKKEDAIRLMGAGVNAKLNVQFTSRLWNEPGHAWELSSGSTFSDIGYQASWDVTRAQPGESGILVNYTGAGGVPDAGGSSNDSPYRTSTSDAGVQGFANDFVSEIGNSKSSVYPGLDQLANGKSTFSRPHLDPNFNSSYSFYKPGQYQLFGGYQGVRQGQIFFAGEHCSQDFQGFMEGGASEGLRAAKDIARSIG